MGPSPRELGPKGTGTRPQRSRPEDNGIGKPGANGQGGLSLHPLSLILSLESSGWDGLKGPFIVFSTNIFYDFGQMNNFSFLGLMFLICKMGSLG